MTTTDTNNQTPPTNQELITEILKLMDLSSMKDDERTMWTVMLPSMEKSELEKLRDTLSREVQKMTDIYLKAKEAMKNEPQN